MKYTKELRRDVELFVDCENNGNCFICHKPIKTHTDSELNKCGKKLWEIERDGEAKAEMRLG